MLQNNSGSSWVIKIGILKKGFENCCLYCIASYKETKKLIQEKVKRVKWLVSQSCFSAMNVSMYYSEIIELILVVNEHDCRVSLLKTLFKCHQKMMNLLVSSTATATNRKRNKYGYLIHPLSTQELYLQWNELAFLATLPV